MEYDIDGYDFESVNLEDRGSTRGVGIYFRKCLKCSKVDTLSVMGENSYIPREVISICLNLEDNKKLILSNIYRSPHSTTKENNAINEFFKSFCDLKHEHQIILGDFNRKDIDWEIAMSTSESDNLFIEAAMDSFLTQHISTPTRGRGTNNPSLIDLIFTSNEDNIDNVSLHAPLGKSDHSLIKFIYRCQLEKLEDKIVWNYAKADFKKMKMKLDIDWDAFFDDSNDDVDLAWEMFKNKYNEAESECVPKKIISTSKKRFSFPLDRKTLAHRKKKHKLWKRYLTTKDAKIYEDYCKCRNQVRRMTRKALKSREKNIAG